MAKKRKQRARGQGGIDLAEIERLLSFMEKHGLEQFEYEREGTRILLKKASVPEASGERPRPAPSKEGHSVDVSTEAHNLSAPSAAPAPPASTPAAEKAEDLHVIKSPIVGTFYWAPSPEAEPFVSVGKNVKAGQVLCIIEAMKLMNEIESDVDGEVAKIFPGNGTPVEYGEPLFGIRASRRK